MPDIVILLIVGGAMATFAGVMAWLSQTSTGKPILRDDNRMHPAE